MPDADLLARPDRTRPDPRRPDPHRPDLRRPDLRRPDLGWRALVALAAIGTAVAGAPTYVVGALSAAALVLAVERLARARNENGADSLLVLVGGVAVAVVLTGLLMGATPIGLSTTTWGVGLGLVSLGCSAFAIVLIRPARLTRNAWRTGVQALPWVVAVVAVAVIAIGISVRSVGPAERAPLQMSFGKVDGTLVQVMVSAAERTGPLELRTTTQGGNEISYPLFSVGADQTYRATVTVPRSGRFTVSVTYPDQTQPLRSLILDR